MKLGIHAGPQDLLMTELKRLWQSAEDAELDWVSVWDHFYANPLTDRHNPCFEGVAAMAGLAALTQHVRVGCLMFCAAFRNPGVLAKAAVTIDHLSDGRADIGVGAGWLEEEFREYGYGWPSLGERFAIMEESLDIMTALWRGEEVTYHGQHFQMEGAVCSPQPIGLRLWIGGRGKTRTPWLAAKYADGFNMPYVAPDVAQRRLDTLYEAAVQYGRDPNAIDTSVNLGFYMLSERQPDIDPRGSLTGSVQEAVDTLSAYQEIGIKGINIAFRPPIDWDAYTVYLEKVVPHFKST